MTAVQSDPDVWPDDEYELDLYRIEILNRIDEAVGCTVRLDYGLRSSEPHYCGIPEWEPFSLKCYDHTPGVMRSWDM